MSLEKLMNITKKEPSTPDEEIEAFGGFEVEPTNMKGIQEGRKFFINFIFEREDEAQMVAEFFGTKEENKLDGQKLLNMIRKFGVIKNGL